MTSIRRTGSALLVAAALSLPTLALAEQAPSAMCDGTKTEQKSPTAERSKQESEKSDQKDKSDVKTDEKTDSSKTRKTS